MERNDEPSELVAALARGLEILEAFDGSAPTMTLSEIAAKTGTSPATARRSLITLEHLGYVRRVGRQFGLTAKVLSLGGAYFDSMSLAGLARPILHGLADTIDHACSLTVLDGNDVVYLAHARAANGPSLRRHYVGARLPAHATSTGHVLLAFAGHDRRAAFLAQAPFTGYTSSTPTRRDELERIFDAVVTHGYARVRDTVEYGAGAVAVPVRDATGTVVAALNASASAARAHDIDEVLDRLDLLHAAAHDLEHALVRFPNTERSA